MDDPRAWLPRMNTLAGRIKTSGEFSSVRQRTFRSSCGSFATLAAIRRASSRVSGLAADRRPDSSSK
jgi:hypothetical protein